MYTVARLQNRKPISTSFLARGNHEDYLIVTDFSKKHKKPEEKDNCPEFLMRCIISSRTIIKCTWQSFSVFTNFYHRHVLCCGTAKHQDYMMCCHGGLELGYNPYELYMHQRLCSFRIYQQPDPKKEF